CIDAKKAAESQGGLDPSIQVDSGAIDNYKVLFGLTQVPFVGQFAQRPVVAGRELVKALPTESNTLELRPSRAADAKQFILCGASDATGKAAPLAGYVVVMDIHHAGELFGLDKGQVSRFDITLEPGVDKAEARTAIEKALRGRATVRTFAEQSQCTQNVMAGL